MLISARLCRVAKCAVLLAITAVFIGCGALPRTVVPADKVELAQVQGMPGVRFWGDTVTPEFIEWLKDGFARERAYLDSQNITQLPPAYYLALSGGGDKGAYGAGLLCGWSDHGDRPTFRIITGVSTGALIAPFAFAGPDYDHVIRQVYTSISMENIARLRSLIGGLSSDSLADTAPLRALLEEHVNDEFLARIAAEYAKGRSLVIGTTNLDAQRPVIWAMGKIASSGHPDAAKLFRDVMLASAAIPGFFPPVMIDVVVNGSTYQEMHVDGGTASQVFLYPASLRLREFADSIGAQRSRSVYVIRNASLDPEYQEVRRTTIAIAGRAISTLIMTQGIGDVYRIYLGAQRDDLDFNLAAIPPEFEFPRDGEFDTKYMRALFDLGYRRAREGYPWAKAPPGFDAPPRIDPPTAP